MEDKALYGPITGGFAPHGWMFDRNVPVEHRVAGWEAARRRAVATGDAFDRWECEWMLLCLRRARST